MKLIIDIPEWKYKSICEGVEASKRCGVVGIDLGIHEAIYNGTPLDTVKAEIEQLRLHKSRFITSDGRVCVDSQDVLEILDNIGKAESEGE